MSRFDDRYGKSRHLPDDAVWARPGARRDDDMRYPGDEFGGTYGHREYGHREPRETGGSPYDAGRDVAGGYPRGYRGVGPKGYERSDDRIREDVCERLTEHDGIDASDVEVRVSRGVVKLTGEVPKRYMKHLAEDAVASAVGVRDVENGIRVRGAGTGERGMFDEPSLG
ncbi:BON domain-containing protein [Luteibacter sp. Lutesp34]|uniref:BON domain-containing protein n=1 Tax=Luteibacter sp. Lutesp34 TaxID=3243030 RepID=UPI0039B457F1